MSGNQLERQLAQVTKTVSDMSVADVKIFRLSLTVPDRIERFFRERENAGFKAATRVRRLKKEDISDFVATHHRALQTQDEEFLREMRSLIEHQGIGSSEEIEFSKQNLIRLGLLKARRKPREHFELTNWTVHSYRESSPSEMRRAQRFQDLQRELSDFESWAREKLTANEARWIDLSDVRKLSVNFEVTSFGKQFAKHVGESG